MLEGDELCDDTSLVPIIRNHAYTEVQFATASSAESSPMRFSIVSLDFCTGEYCETLKDAA
jgi:hypothetical protein